MNQMTSLLSQSTGERGIVCSACILQHPNLTSQKEPENTMPLLSPSPLLLTLLLPDALGAHQEWSQGSLGPRCWLASSVGKGVLVTGSPSPVTASKGAVLPWTSALASSAPSQVGQAPSLKAQGPRLGHWAPSGWDLGGPQLSFWASCHGEAFVQLG